MNRGPAPVSSFKVPCNRQDPDCFYEQHEFDELGRQPCLIIGSSHCSAYHYFPTQLNRVWREGFNMNNKVNYPLVNALSGRKYDLSFLREYSEDILPTLTKPTIIIFNLGCNNIDTIAQNLPAAKVQVLKTIRQIIRMHREDQHLLAFTGIQPRWSSNRPQSRARYDLDLRIRNLIQTYVDADINIGHRIGFERLSHVFRENNQLIFRYFAPDGTHLSREGASALAQHLCNMALHAACNYLTCLARNPSSDHLNLPSPQFQTDPDGPSPTPPPPDLEDDDDTDRFY